MKLQSIQALRGLAALLVLIFHVHQLEVLAIADNNLTEQAWAGGIFTNGYAGVDLFFVISGFIMVFVTRNSMPGPRQAAGFLFARVTRIYPVWWAFAGCMTIYMLAAYGLSGQSDGWQKASYGQPVVPFLVKSFLLVPQPAFPILNVGWTLVHEVYFYAVFTLFMLLPRKWLPILIGAWAVLVITGALSGLSGPLAMNGVSLVFHPMTLEFILGAVAGLAITNGLIWRSGILTLIATLWLLAALCYQGHDTAFQLEWGRVLWFGLPAALLVYAVAGLDIGERHAWLIPALSGWLVTMFLFNLTGLDGNSSAAARRDATLLTVTVGGIGMLIVIWFGWLLGQSAPDLLRRTKSFFRPILTAAVKLGDWSFALYLSHLIVLSILRRIFAMLGQSEILAPVFRLGHPGTLDNAAYTVTGIGLTILVSWLSYRMYEYPLTILFGRLRTALFRRGQSETTPA